MVCPIAEAVGEQLSDRVLNELLLLLPQPVAATGCMDCRAHCVMLHARARERVLWSRRHAATPKLALDRAVFFGLVPLLVVDDDNLSSAATGHIVSRVRAFERQTYVNACIHAGRFDATVHNSCVKYPDESIYLAACTGVRRIVEHVAHVCWPSGEMTMLGVHYLLLGACVGGHVRWIEHAVTMYRHKNAMHAIKWPLALEMLCMNERADALESVCAATSGLVELTHESDTHKAYFQCGLHASERMRGTLDALLDAYRNTKEAKPTQLRRSRRILMRSGGTTTTTHHAREWMDDGHYLLYARGAAAGGHLNVCKREIARHRSEHCTCWYARRHSDELCAWSIDVMHHSTSDWCAVARGTATIDWAMAHNVLGCEEIFEHACANGRIHLLLAHHDTWLGHYATVVAQTFVHVGDFQFELDNDNDDDDADAVVVVYGGDDNGDYAEGFGPHPSLACVSIALSVACREGHVDLVRHMIDTYEWSHVLLNTRHNIEAACSNGARGMCHLLHATFGLRCRYDGMCLCRTTPRARRQRQAH